MIEIILKGDDDDGQRCRDLLGRRIAHLVAGAGAEEDLCGVEGGRGGVPEIKKRQIN